VLIRYLAAGEERPSGVLESTGSTEEESISSVGVFEPKESVHAYMDFLNTVASYVSERDRRTRVLSVD
jgi:hypothetical protein